VLLQILLYFHNLEMAPGDTVEEAALADGVTKSTCVDLRQRVKDEKASHDLVLKTFRLLIADLCQQYNGGHPG